MKHYLTFCFLALGQLVYANYFEQKPVPDWVKPVEIPNSSKVSKYDVIGGAYTSLIDQQINFMNEADFSHLVIDIVTNAGVGYASEISIPYDSSYQQLEFHYLRVWRDGEMLDRTDQLTFEFLRNEQQLDVSIYTGQVTAYDVLEDIRKGDRLEYAFTIIGDNPIFEGKGFRFITLEQVNPIDRFFLRIIHDKKETYKSRCNACNSVEVKEYDEEENHIIELRKDNVAAGDFEETVPAWCFPYGYFTISNFDSWKDVNQWASSVFHLSEEPDLDALLNEIKQSNKTLEKQIDAAINYVQDDIRYMGMENGIGSIKPFPPDKVLKQRFGDCKDKSLLLVTLLRKLGLKSAYPALVNTSLFRGVEKMLPAGQVFNHCIVHFQHNGKDHWVDPTQSMQAGNFSTLCIPDYGKALVIGLKNGQLKDMEIDDKITRTDLTEDFFFTSTEEPCTLKVETNHHGLMADYMRASLEYLSRKEISDHYRENYGRAFPNIRSLGSIEIADDEEKNVLTTVETYVLTSVWKPFNENSLSGWTFRYEPIEVYNYVSQMECDEKKHPVQLPYPTAFKQSTKIHLPEPLEVPTEEVTFDNDGFTYTNSILAVNDSLVQLNYSFATKTDEIQPESFYKLCNDMNEITRQISMIFTYSKFNLDKEKFKQSLRSHKPLPKGKTITD